MTGNHACGVHVIYLQKILQLSISGKINAKMLWLTFMQSSIKEDKLSKKLTSRTEWHSMLLRFHAQRVTK